MSRIIGFLFALVMCGNLVGCEGINGAWGIGNDGRGNTDGGYTNNTLPDGGSYIPPDGGYVVPDGGYVAVAPRIDAWYSDLTSTSVTINWSSNGEPVKAEQIFYRTSNNSTSTVIPGFVNGTSGAVSAAGLSSNTGYFFWVSATSSATNLTGVSAEKYFETPLVGSTDTVPPIVTALGPQIGSGSVQFPWQSNEALKDVYVDIGTDTNLNSPQHTAVSTGSGGSGTGTIAVTTTFVTGVQYYFRIGGHDMAGNLGQTAVQALTLLPNITAAIGVVEDTRASISWSSTSYVTQVYARCANDPAFTVFVLPYFYGNPNEHSIPLYGLSPSSHYYCKVFGQNVNFVGVSDLVDIITMNQIGTGIEANQFADSSDPTLVNFGWLAPVRLQDVRVEVGTDAALINVVQTTTGQVSQQVVGVITVRLSSGGVYFYRLVGRDLTGNQLTSNIKSFTTSPTSSGEYLIYCDRFSAPSGNSCQVKVNSPKHPGYDERDYAIRVSAQTMCLGAPVDGGPNDPNASQVLVTTDPDGRLYARIQEPDGTYVTLEQNPNPDPGLHQYNRATKAQLHCEKYVRLP